jgi:hypothetical protein
MQGMIGNGLTNAAAAETLHHAFAMDILLSNLGKTQFESTFGHLKLESLWGPAVLGGLRRVQTVGAATTNGFLCLLLTSYEPIPLLLQTAETILSDIARNRNQLSSIFQRQPPLAHISCRALVWFLRTIQYSTFSSPREERFAAYRQVAHTRSDGAAAPAKSDPRPSKLAQIATITLSPR